MSNIPLSSVHQAGGSIGTSGDTPDVMTAATQASSHHLTSKNQAAGRTEEPRSGIKEAVIERNDSRTLGPMTPTIAKKDTPTTRSTTAHPLAPSGIPPDAVLLLQSEGKMAATATQTEELEAKVSERHSQQQTHADLAALPPRCFS